MHFSAMQPWEQKWKCGRSKHSSGLRRGPPVSCDCERGRLLEKKKQKTPASELIHEGETQANTRASKHPSLCLQLQVTDTIARFPSLPRVGGWRAEGGERNISVYIPERLM